MFNLLIYIYSLMVTIDINVSNFTSGFLRYAFDPYTSIFANLAWGIIFGFIGAGLYVGSRSIITMFTFLTLVGIIFAIILPWAIVAIFGLILVFIGTTAFYVILVEERQ